MAIGDDATRPLWGILFILGMVLVSVNAQAKKCIASGKYSTNTTGSEFEDGQRTISPEPSPRIIGVCSTWGNYHFKTFDSMIFRFPGLCNYCFASHCQSPTKLFHIQLRRSQQSDFPSITEISVKITGTLIEIKGDVIYVNGVPSNQSFINPEVQIARDKSSITITAEVGLVLEWNRLDRLELQLDAKYSNQTCGLCGDFNGDMINEFIVKDEMLTEIDYGKLQKLVDPAESCEDSLSEDMQEYPQEDDFCISTVAKMQDCLERLDPSLFVEACIKDSVNCEGPQNMLCMCSTLSEFSKQCAHFGGKLINWRTSDVCYIECPLNLEFEECGSACADTCSNQEHSQICTDECYSGCSCPAGTVYDDINFSGCINQDKCSCTRRGKIYPPGSSFTTECLICICKGGQWSCDKRPCPSTCSVEGTLHISTFDSTNYNFNGDCTYILAKDCKNKTFVVEGSLQRNTEEGQVSVLTSVLLRMNDKIVVIDRSGTIIVSSISISRFPYSDGTISIFKPSTSSIVLYTTTGIRLQIDFTPLMMFYITLDPSYKGSTCGLCGNYNDYQSDDFKCNNGLAEATAAAAANTWKILASCPDVQITFKDPCSLNTGVEQYAQQWCKQLKDRKGPFAKCHSVVNPNAYYKLCLYDTCSCKNSDVCMCATIEAYVRKCAIKEIYLKNWRNFICSDMIPVCPESMVYIDYINTCQPSCRSLSEPWDECSISFVPLDGCICKQGTYLDEDGACVPPIKCPCYTKNGIMEPKTTTLENGASCTCSLGKVTCSFEKSSDCKDPKFYFNCSSAAVGTPGFQCQKRCNNLEGKCDSMQCTSGCMCPADLVMNDDGDCIKEVDCTCTRNGISYQRGESITVGCNTCECSRGKWNCTQEEVLGTCVLYGEGHYITFDNRRYVFNGNCEYILAQDFCDSVGTFRVITENVPCGTIGTTCSKSIKLYVGSCLLILSGNHYKETVCKIEQVPYKVREHGIFLVIDVGTGLILIWDKKTRITIKLTSDYKGKVCGLCGNYDDDRNNDFNTRSQVTVGTALVFGNTWKSSPKCPDANNIPDACFTNPKRKPAALKGCQIIISNLFAACHSQVDAIPYYDACLSDTCACDTGEDCECLCTAVAAYAEACNKACICIHWRTPEVCPLFCDYYNQQEGRCEWHYKPCGAPCMKTCRNPSGQCLHDIPGLEGCYPNCPTDRPYLEENSMECIAQCGCYDVDGKYYNVGDQLDICDSCLNCTCTVKGISCKYDVEACFCDYEERIYLYKELIYQQKDPTGSCINVTCGLNGTLDKTYYTCLETTHTTTFKSTTVTKSSDCLYEVCNWSPWYDSSQPQLDEESGEFETFDNIRGQGYTICSTPLDINCRAERFQSIPIDELNQIVQCDKSFGLTCYNDQQTFLPWCFNYQIQVLCCQFVPCNAISSSTETPIGNDCVCSANGNIFSPGDVVYKTIGSNGCVLYAICSSVCTIRTYQGECVTTTTVPKTSTQMTLQSTTTATTMGTTPETITTTPETSTLPTSSSTSGSITVTSTYTTSSSTTTRSTIKQFDPTEIPPIIHIINCSNSVCEMTGNRSILTVICPSVLVPVCLDGNPPAKVYDEDVCCFEYECRYCTGPDGEPKLSGETWQSGCNECFCSKNFTVQCTPVFCDTPMVAACDKEGFELIEVPDPNNPCCPFEQCQCNPNLCRRPPNSCDPGFEFIVGFEEGDCCASYGCVPKKVCVVNGLEYPPLSPVPADIGSCTLCNCTEEMDQDSQLNMVMCQPISCITDCQPGYIVIENDGECCGSCVQVACVVEMEDGTLEVHQPGEVWRDLDSNCTTYRCEQTGTTFTLGEVNTICSPFVPEICQPGTIEMTSDGCCQTCQVNVTKPCSLRTMEVEVTHKSCTSVVELDYCEGPCMSSSMYVQTTQRWTRKCSCCKEVLTRSKEVRLLCRDSTYINYNVTNVAQCGCVTATCVN